MTVTLSRLANGLSVVTHEMAHLETISLGLWVASGARHESEAEHGVSHFLEHMAFKGTTTRSARSIAEEIENVGGEINAATGMETTAYFARALEGDDGLAIEIIADILQRPRFEEADIEVERAVILQEIAATRDAPEEIAYDLLEATAFPNQALGRPILGTENSVSAMAETLLETYLEAHYTPARMVLSAAGGVSHDAIVRHAGAQFGGLDRGGDRGEAPARYVGGAAVHAEPFEQTHAMLAFAGPSYRSEDYLTAQVLAGVLGGGASSRLFQQVRERRGLCYSIYAFVSAFNDAGLFGVHAATGPKDVTKLIGVVMDEIAEVAEAGPSIAEVARAKVQLKAGLLMSLESSGARAEQMARQVAVHGRPLETAELVARLEAVTVERVRSMMRGLLAGAQPIWIEVGAKASRRGHDTVLERIGRLGRIAAE